MSITKSIIISGFSPSFHVEPSRRRTSTLYSYSSSNIAIVNNIQDKSFSWGNNGRANKDDKNRRRFLVRSVVQPGSPPPSEPPFNFINWIVGVAVTIVLPFFSYKWASLLKLKTEVDTAVEAVEGIVVAVGKVAEEVEKVAEDIVDDLPEGGSLRKAVDFVEHVAERANKDAHLVEDFINKVQEVEDKVEDYVESLAEYEHPKEEQQEDREPGHREPPKEENSDGKRKD